MTTVRIGVVKSKDEVDQMISKGASLVIVERQCEPFNSKEGEILSYAYPISGQAIILAKHHGYPVTPANEQHSYAWFLDLACSQDIIDKLTQAAEQLKLSIETI